MKNRAFLICMVVLIARGWSRLAHPAISAEDGKYFLHDAFAGGWTVILKPLSGMFSVLPRLVAEVMTIVPVYWIPFWITFLCYVLFAWAMSRFTGKEYGHLVPSPSGRLAIAVGFCLVPGMSEVLGNLANLHRPLAAFILFLGLKRSEDKLSKWDLLTLFLAAGSAGEAIIFIPFFMLRAQRRFKRLGPIGVSRDYLAIAIIIGWACASLIFREAQPWGGLPTFTQTIRAVLAAFSSDLILQPIVGWRMTLNLFKIPFFYWLVVMLISFLFFRGSRRRFRRGEYWAELASLSFVAIQFLGWWVRPGSIEHYQTFAPDMPWWQMRESYFLAFAGFLLWALRAGRKSGYRAQAYVLIYLILAPKLAIEPYGNTAYWLPVAEKWQRSLDTSCPRAVYIPTFPAGWAFSYSAQKPSPGCRE